MPNPVEIKAVTDYATMLSSLQQDDLATTFEMAEVPKLSYFRDTEFGSVEFASRAGRLTLTEWSARQLCKLCGVPFGVWTKASEKLASDMLQEFLPNIKDPQRKLVVRSRGNKTTLRGLLPVDYPDIRNSQILKAVGDNVTHDFVVNYANWLDEANTPIFRTRFIIKGLSFHLKDINEDIYLGIDCLSSEVGASDLQINLLAFRPTCTNGAMIVFGKRTFYHYTYATAPLMSIDDIMPLCVQRLESSLNEVHQTLTASISQKVTLDQAKQLLLEMAEKAQLNKGVALKSIAEMEKSGVANMWDVGNAITATARGYRDTLRLRYEIAGGALMGLSLKRQTKQEEEWVGNVAPYALPTQLMLSPVPPVQVTGP